MDKEREYPPEDISREIKETVPKPEEIVTTQIAEKEERIAKGVSEMPIITEELEERKKKVLNFLKQKHIWVIGLLIIALILGAYIRSMPMHDHGGLPGLWDVTTNTWTLGPDLDPWLFTRYAKTIVEQGSLPAIDMMRNVPLGFNTLIESKLLPYMMAYTYYFLHLFDSSVDVEFAAVIFPVIMFSLTILSFFLFSRELFVKKSEQSKTKANIIALIATFFMIVIPSFLSRTIAGIPEKESAAFFFMFLSFYLFLRSWKADTFKKTLIWGILSGISTGCMGLIWGGVVYVFIGIALTTFLGFILGRIKTRGFIIYSTWFISSLVALLSFSNKYSLSSLMQSTDYVIAFITFFVLLVNYLLWKTNLSNMRILSRIKIPRNITSLLVSLIMGFVIVVFVLGPEFLLDKIQHLINTFITPTTGRWQITVAENRQPYFTEWGSSFGPFIKGIPLLFWLFFLGSLVLFRKMVSCLKKKDGLVLTGLYILFFLGLVFSRYSGSSILNGENFISKLFYFGSALILFVGLIRYYLKYEKEGYNYFKKIDYKLLFLFSLFVLILVTVRSAVRLIMVLGPIASIFVGYLIYESISWFRKIKDETWKFLVGIFIILILLASIFTFWTFYQGVKNQAYNTVPSHYHQQWQKAMSWVREETPKDAVFSHWWDYGYWVQSIGERSTVLDGGNTIVYWNYLLGRLVLTGDNQDDALEFLYSHDATHLLIDSSDIGKYTAFSSIGSDENYDRYSWISTFLIDERQTLETQEQMTYIYTGGTAFDEDLIIEEEGKEILLPRQRAGIGAIVVPKNISEEGEEFVQPYIFAVYQGQQHKINLKYLSVGGEFFEFNSGINACAYIFPKIDTQPQGVQVNPIGAAMYLSPRLMRGMLSQLYILDDPLDNFGNFEVVHSEPSIIIDSLNQQGMGLPEFVYFQGIQGPIKIWDIYYSGKEQKREEYLDIDYTKYINWSL